MRSRTSEHIRLKVWIIRMWRTLWPRVSRGARCRRGRAALCWNEELAALARQHNDANVLSLPARFISVELAKRIVEKFLESSFEGGRHLRRVNKIPCGSSVRQ